MIVGEEKPSLDELFHYGVKGMKWGVRRDNKGGITVGGKHFDKKQVRKAAVIFGSAVGVAAIAVGSAYAAHRMGAFDKRIVDIPSPTAAAVKFTKSMAEQPVGIVHATRGRSKGFTFPSHGGLTDPLQEYQRSGLSGAGDGSGVGTSYFKRYGDRAEKVAASFLDPDGRKDFAGRPIHHEVMLPEELARGVNSAQDAADVAWPLIKDKYDAFYES